MYINGFQYDINYLISNILLIIFAEKKLMKIINRSVEKQILKYLKQYPIVAIIGARQVGKSTLAHHIANLLKKPTVFYDLELPSDVSKLYDPESTFMSNKNHLIIIDEAQTMPQLFNILRSIVDKQKKNGRFILLGSVSPSLIKEISQTLAGRVVYVELGGINLTESIQSKIDYKKLWLRGGFPKPLLFKTNALWYNWMENYVRTFVERDVNILMQEKLSSFTVRKIWQMLSGVHANLLNYEDLSRSLGLSRATVMKYVDFLEGAFLIRRLQPWHLNIPKRVVKSPKIYFRDSGLLHYMHGISSYNELDKDIVIGASWEGFVIEQICQHLNKYNFYFYRTHHGAECDLIIARGNKPIACIEIKLSNAPEIPKGFINSIDDLRTAKNFIITPQSDDYAYKNIRICSLQTFIQKYLNKI